MHICLVTDAWYPQINGVVTTWNHVREELAGQGHRFDVIHPAMFRTFAAPKYPEIRLAVLPGRRLGRALEQMQPDAIHIATEGSVGFAARRYCVKRRIPFTTSYHTRFPQYLKAYFEIPEAATYTWVRWFHKPAERILVPTVSIRDDLAEHGFRADRIVVWTRGVKHDRFRVRPGEALPLDDLPRPRFLYCGRVAVEKNLEAFLKLDLPGSKIIVGDGPALEDLKARYPGVHFVGYKTGEDLARHVACGEVFVFPSLTDTFGVVMIEAMACGLPVAAYPVPGPKDIIVDGKVGAIDTDLRAACLRALDLDGAECVTYAEQFTWRRCAQMVLENLAVIGGDN